jgi:hypothetical protein
MSELTPLERRAVQDAVEIFGPANMDLFAVVEAIAGARAQRVLAAVEAEHEPTGIPESAVRWYLLGQQAAARRARSAIA